MMLLIWNLNILVLAYEEFAYHVTFGRVHVASIARNITYDESGSVALVTQQVKRKWRFVLSSVARLSLCHFSTLSHKRDMIFGKISY